MENKINDTAKVFIYCYTLCTDEQKKNINLVSYKVKLNKIFKEFFKDRLADVVVKKNGYTLKLKDPYTVGEKRKLGRVISENTDLKKYVYRITYNNNVDKSGQLFKICKKGV